MESTPGVFPLFIALMAFLTSASVGGLVSMLRSSGTGGGGGGVGGFIWLRVVRDFTEIFNPSINLFTFSCNSAAIFAFHRGRVSSVIW